MLAYWSMFLVALAGALAPRRLPRRQHLLVLTIAGAFFAVLMGFRDSVGGDWITYQYHFAWSASVPLREALTARSDPGYYGLGWLLARIGGDIYWLNFCCAVLLAGGTVHFCSRQPRPWLVLLVAVPYLLIVVGMGYTRQSAAIGCAMFGLAALGEARVRRFVGWVLAAALFHKTAVLLIPIAALAASRNRVWTAVWVTVMAILGGYLFLYDESEMLWNNYVVSDYAYASQGAGIRAAMNALPAGLLLLFRRRLVPDLVARKLWLWIAVLALGTVPLLAFSPTAVDRMALYFIPIQLMVLSRLPGLAKSVRDRTLLVLGVVVYCFTVQFVWLNFAATAFAWVPYHFMPPW